MNIHQLKLVVSVLLLELLMCGLFAFFAEYHSDADARNERHSFDPVYGGISPENNQLWRKYSS